MNQLAEQSQITLSNGATPAMPELVAASQKNPRLAALIREMKPHLTGRQIAHCCGVSHKTWCNVLNRRTIPTYDTARRIANFFDLPVEEIFEKYQPNPAEK